MSPKLWVSHIYPEGHLFPTHTEALGRRRDNPREKAQRERLVRSRDLNPGPSYTHPAPIPGTILPTRMPPPSPKLGETKLTLLPEANDCLLLLGLCPRT